MSNTDKQIGSPQGYAVVDPSHFSNPKMDGGCVGQAAHRPATDPQFTTTKTRSTDNMMKDSAGPRVGKLPVPGVHAVSREARGIENFGK